MLTVVSEPCFSQGLALNNIELGIRRDLNLDTLVLFSDLSRHCLHLRHEQLLHVSPAHESVIFVHM